MRNSLILLCVALLCGLSTPRVAAAPPPDYAHAPGMGPLMHWARMPVRVYFAPGGAIRFQPVADPAQADLVVRFIADATVPGHSGAVGHTVLTHAGPILVRADMTLATAGVSPDELEGTAAHEFGHALGLNGHSDDPADLMYPSTTRIFLLDGTALPQLPRFVTARDLNTLWSATLPYALALPRLPMSLLASIHLRCD